MIRIALAGYGHVGESLAELIRQNASFSQRFEIVAILVKDISKPRKGFDKSMFFDDLDAFFACEFDVLVDVLSGIEPSLSLLFRTLSDGFAVVTANKASLAAEAPRLFEMANTTHAKLYFEASCMSGIPVVHGLYELAQTDTITHIEGIVNGSTNYCLSRYFEDGIDWQEALDEATSLGFLERDPSQDLDGFDAMRKLQLLSMLAFSVFPEEAAVNRISLQDIPNSFFRKVRNVGWTMKYVASASMIQDQFVGQVVPMIFRAKQGLAMVSRETNQLQIHGQHRGIITYTGAGAGGYPTALGVLTDLLWLESNLNMKPHIHQIVSHTNSNQKHHYWVEDHVKILSSWIDSTVQGLVRTIPLTFEEAKTLPCAIQEAS